MASDSCLNFCVPSENSRLVFAKPTNQYSDKVLVGSWFDERRCREAIPRDNEIKTTTYSDDFGAKPYAVVSPNAAWDLRIKTQVSSL